MFKETTNDSKLEALDSKRKYFKKFSLVCIWACLLMSLYCFMVGTIGFILSDKNYMYVGYCGLDPTCLISQQYYAEHPFSIGFFGLMCAAIIACLAQKADSILKQQSNNQNKQS